MFTIDAVVNHFLEKFIDLDTEHWHQIKTVAGTLPEGARSLSNGHWLTNKPWRCLKGTTTRW